MPSTWQLVVFHAIFFQVIVFAEGFIDKVEQGTVFDEEDQMR